jgi:hypothetical protein
MLDYMVETGDDKGNSFKILVSISTFDGRSSGSWRAIDKGYIRFNSGIAAKQDSPGELAVRHLLLYSSDNTWGIRLNDFQGWLGANDQGTGLILQPWVLNFTAGRISWALVE